LEPQWVKVRLISRKGGIEVLSSLERKNREIDLPDLIAVEIEKYGKGGRRSWARGKGGKFCWRFSKKADKMKRRKGRKKGKFF